jgi:hypothetical protein
MSQLAFERGNADRPRGHALVFIRDAGSERVAATYLVVLPIAIDVAKYLPPMLAAQMGHQQDGPPAATPLPPVPEPIEGGLAFLRVLAELRDDDLIDGGQTDIDRMDGLMRQTAFVSQAYTEIYQTYADSAGRLAEPDSTDEPELNSDDLSYALMGDAERLSELVKITGRIRDGVDHGDASQVREMLAQARLVTRHLAEKYKAEDLLRAAETPGEAGRTLTELLVERCFALYNEDYLRVQALEQRLRTLG